MFSGMFTHCVKPALTAQQAQELFALLGYQPAGNDEEELRLSTKPVPSHVLLQLAYAFFTARIECQLLLTAVASLDGSMACMLQLIQERKRGYTFQTALDSAKRMLEPAPCDTPSALDPNLDLYTDKYLADQSHMASPPSLPYIPPSEDPSPHKVSRSNTLHSNKERNEKKAQTIAVSSLTCQIKSVPKKIDSGLKTCENDRQFTTMCNAQLSAANEGHHVCNCLSYDPCPKQCLRCQEIHSVNCPGLTSCIEQDHEVVFAQQPMMPTVFQSRQDQTQHWEKPAKDGLKQHSCINNPSNDFFSVCHDCHYIHDLQCEEVVSCLCAHHNVQKTGQVQPAESKVTTHTCITAKDTDYIVCHTCNKSHSIFCNEANGCQISEHNVEYLLDSNKAIQTKPMPFHQCCTSTEKKFACLTCRVFHAFSCDDNQCQRKHEVQDLKYTCYTCSDSRLYILCRYCCAQLCKNCWFKDPLDCICGMPFVNTPV